MSEIDALARLSTRNDASPDEDWRYAGKELGLDLNEGLSNLGLEDLRRLRSDKVVPRTFGSEIGRGLSHYEASGSYQPEVAYGQ